MTVKDHHPHAPSNEGELKDETYYTDLLKMQLANSKYVLSSVIFTLWGCYWTFLYFLNDIGDDLFYRKDAEKLKEELSMARMKALSESQRVLELERKLYGTEQALKLRHSDNMKLQVKLEELKIKYTPNGNHFSFIRLRFFTFKSTLRIRFVLNNSLWTFYPFMCKFKIL